ncbi:MAG: hypothetical protein ABR925_01295 [Acidimicrobiales bacterium]
MEQAEDGHPLSGVGTASRDPAVERTDVVDVVELLDVLGDADPDPHAVRATPVIAAASPIKAR